MQKEQFNCRFYENIYPVVDELVVVRVEKIIDNGAYVKLLEYNLIEGMITPNEYTKQANLRSVQRAIKVHRVEVVQVLKVDQEKGYIDLSKKRVQADKLQQAEDKYNKSKQVHSIIYNVASQSSNLDSQYLYEKIVWPLQKDSKIHVLEHFKNALIEPQKVFENLDISQEIKQKLHQEIKKRLEPKAVKIRSDFEVKCYTSEGIDAIKYALQQGQKISDSNCQIKIQVYACPQYFAFTSCYDKAFGIKKLNEALNEIEKSIIEKKGKFQVISKPKVYGEKEEEQMKDMLNKLQKKKIDQSDQSQDEDDDDFGSDTWEENQIIEDKQEI